MNSATKALCCAEEGLTQAAAGPGGLMTYMFRVLGF